MAVILFAAGMYFAFPFSATAQSRIDTMFRNKNGFFFKWAQKGIDAISRNGADTTDYRAAYKSHVETYYQPYEGKIIRHIDIEAYGFEKSFSDTTTSIKYFGTNLLNHLHTKTKSWVIRNNLFIKEGMPLNANMVADNERYLRSLNYIRDARILVKMIDPASDSVDLLVVTKDFFSLTGEIKELNIPEQLVNVSDENFLGFGQLVSATVLNDNSRKPHAGADLRYNKYNVFGAFTSLGVEYSNIGNNLYTGQPDEEGVYITADRPLYSQYASYYWSLHLSDALSHPNYGTFQSTDPDFYRYHYKMLDATFGYNIGAKRSRNSVVVPMHEVLSMRYYNYNFLESPHQFYNQFVELLNSRQAVLGQFTLFKQQFYKTNYVLGFGTTEDIPYGFNLSVTGGWYRLKTLSRPYFGIDANRYFFSDKGSITQLFLRTGTYINNGLQDATALLGVSAYSRLIYWKSYKIRQFIRFSYTGQFNTYAQEPLRISNPFGLEYFNRDSVQGTQRITLRSQTVIFCRGKILGFAFAPYLSGDISYLTTTVQSMAQRPWYYNVGGGVRVRNENLVFGTIDLHAMYYPRKIATMRRFVIGVSSNLRFRYNSNYVTAPELLEYNSDVNDDIF